jgi:trans-aconitate methyltransferase
MTLIMQYRSQPDWEEAYHGTPPPRDIGRPQPAFAALVDEGQVRPGKALDVGCGTGHTTVAIW